MAIASITVGQAARRTGLSEKAIRLYEAKGLLLRTERTPAGYRTYSEEDIDVLRFIRQARALGLRLEEIRDIIDLQRHGAQPCQKVLRLVDSHIREIDRTIADLKALRGALAAARRAAEESSQNGGEAVVCRIIESLGETRPRPTASTSVSQPCPPPEPERPPAAPARGRQL